jgi:hypothetical protein
MGTTGRQAGRQDRCLQGERIIKKKVPETKPEDLDCQNKTHKAYYSHR